MNWAHNTCAQRSTGGLFATGAERSDDLMLSLYMVPADCVLALSPLRICLFPKSLWSFILKIGNCFFKILMGKELNCLVSFYIHIILTVAEALYIIIHPLNLYTSAYIFYFNHWHGIRNIKTKGVLLFKLCYILVIEWEAQSSIWFCNLKIFYENKSLYTIHNGILFCPLTYFQ